MFKFYFLLLFISFLSLISYSQTFRINEIMSSNISSIKDSDGESSDWIEFYNSGTSSINLKGYGLSDKIDEPFKWTFPELTIAPGKYLLVFASGKDRQDPPLFWNTIISKGDTWKYLVPTTEPAINWRNSSFSDAPWKSGVSGFGFGDEDDATIVQVPNSILLRKKFTITNIATVRQLILHMDYDDGFVAYLNGVEVARSQIEGLTPRFDVIANGHEAAMYQGFAPEKFEISDPGTVLKNGENILAIQVHNAGTTSSDLTAIPFLSVGTTEKPTNQRIVAELVFPGSELHSNFKIDADGESIYLTDLSSKLVDSVHVDNIPFNGSYGRSVKNPGEWVIFTESTPFAENLGTEFSEESAGKPIFSIEGLVVTHA